MNLERFVMSTNPRSSLALPRNVFFELSFLFFVCNFLVFLEPFARQNGNFRAPATSAHVPKERKKKQ